MLPLVPKAIVRRVSRRYIAGDVLSDAVEVTKRLMAEGISTTIDVLGEFVGNRERALAETQMSLEVVKAIKDHQLDAYLSLKPTSLGLAIDEAFAYENISSVVSAAAKQDIFVRMDMENSPYTSLTLDLYRKLRNNGLSNVGVVVQAYMRRSMTDVESLLEYSPSIRLCKGIYREAPEIAYQDATEIRESYKSLLRLLFKGAGSVHIATHDEELLAYSEALIKNSSIQPERYEFQMLLGVRANRRDSLRDGGHRVRVYVPFGEDWYGYSVRRLIENPAIAVHILRAVFKSS